MNEQELQALLQQLDAKLVRLMRVNGYSLEFIAWAYHCSGNFAPQNPVTDWLITRIGEAIPEETIQQDYSAAFGKRSDM